MAYFETGRSGSPKSGSLESDFSFCLNVSRTIGVAPLLFYVLLSGIVQASDPPLCPGYESLEWSDDVRAICYENMSESTSQCEKLVQRLSSRKTLTTQQRFDLAEAQQTLAVWILEGKETLPRFEELRISAARNFERLRKERPNDISVLFNLFLLTDTTPFQRNRSDYPYLQHILNIASDCSRVRKYLLREMNYTPEYLSDEDSIWVSEVTNLLQEGYRLAPDKLSKMEFAAMRFNSELHKYGYHFAKSFRQKVYTELNIATLKYDGESRHENLNAVCDYSAFHLQFTNHCIDAIEEALKIDSDLARMPDAAVLEAIRKMGYALINTRGTSKVVLHHPVQNQEYSFLGFPFFPYEATRYTIRLSDILRQVPTELHSIDFYRVASRLMGTHEKIAFLERLSERDPSDSTVQAYLTHLISD